MINMRDNVLMGLVVVAAGATLIRSLRPTGSKSKPRTWLPVIALVAGPAFTVGYVVIDAYFVSPVYYVHPDDFAGGISAALYIGIVAGVITAAAIGLAER